MLQRQSWEDVACAPTCSCSDFASSPLLFPVAAAAPESPCRRTWWAPQKPAAVQETAPVRKARRRARPSCYAPTADRRSGEPSWPQNSPAARCPRPPAALAPADQQLAQAQPRRQQRPWSQRADNSWVIRREEQLFWPSFSTGNLSNYTSPRVEESLFSTRQQDDSLPPRAHSWGSLAVWLRRDTLQPQSRGNVAQVPHLSSRKRNFRPPKRGSSFFLLVQHYQRSVCGDSPFCGLAHIVGKGAAAGQPLVGEACIFILLPAVGARTVWFF